MDMIAATNTQGPSPYLMALPGALALMTYALVNGVPFVYPDSFVYHAYGQSAWQKVADALAGLWPGDAMPAAAPDPAGAAPGAGSPDTAEEVDWSPSAGRSAYYGALAALPGPFATPWNGVIVQVYCCAVAVALAWRSVTGGIGWGYVAAMAGAGLFTTFGFFASTAMPDVWAAILMLSLALLVARRDRLGRWDATVLWAFVLGAASFHSTDLALLAVLIGLCTLGHVARIGWLRWPGSGTALTAVAVLVAAIGMGTLERWAVERASGKSPHASPYLTAHLVDGGPGMAFIRDACPEAGFAICERVDRLPAEWRDFIFQVVAAPESYTRRVASEDLAFAWATLRHDPVAVAGLALRDALRQIVMIDLATTPIRAAIGERAAVENTSDPLGRTVTDGRLYDAGWLYRAVSAANTALVVAGSISLAAILAMSPSGAHRGLDADGLRRLISVCIAGILANAVICGVLASPYDRFQARVAWLIPVLAVIALVARSRGVSGRTIITTLKEGGHELR